MTLPAKGDTITVTATVQYSNTGYYDDLFVVLKDENGVSYTTSTKQRLCKNMAPFVTPQYRVPGAPSRNAQFDNYGTDRGATWEFTARVKEVGEYRGEPQVKVTHMKLHNVTITDHARKDIERQIEKAYEADSHRACMADRVEEYRNMEPHGEWHWTDINDQVRFWGNYEDEFCPEHRRLDWYDRVKYQDGKPVGESWLSTLGEMKQFLD